MNGEIVLNLAVSIDGFIAEEDGGYEWIAGQGDARLDTEVDYPFSDFLKDVDVVVMGNSSYHQGLDSYMKDYTDQKVYVATHAKRADYDNIHFISGDVVDIVVKERDAGKRVYLFGGGILIDPFIKANTIDRYIIGVIPVLLGKGRPLFLGNNPTIPLQLERYSLRDGVMVLHYHKR